MACLRLFTLPPLPPLPERSVPLFLRRVALATVLPAPLLYLRPPDFFFAAIFLSLLICLVPKAARRLSRPGAAVTRSRNLFPKLTRGLYPTTQSRQSSCDSARHAPGTQQTSTLVPP